MIYFFRRWCECSSACLLFAVNSHTSYQFKKNCFVLFALRLSVRFIQKITLWMIHNVADFELSSSLVHVKAREKIVHAFAVFVTQR